MQNVFVRRYLVNECPYHATMASAYAFRFGAFATQSHASARSEVVWANCRRRPTMGAGLGSRARYTSYTRDP